MPNPRTLNPIPKEKRHRNSLANRFEAVEDSEKEGEATQDILITDRHPSTTARKRFSLLHWINFQKASQNDPTLPPTDDDVLSMVAYMINTTKPRNNTQQATSAKTIEGNLRMLYSVLLHEYNYKASPQVVTQSQSLINSAVNDGRLTRLISQDKKWLQFHTVTRINSAYLQVARNSGSPSYDDVFKKLLAITLLVSLDLRGGDGIATTTYMKDCYMRLLDIRLYIPLSAQGVSEPTEIFQQLEAVVKIQNRKGKKYGGAETQKTRLRVLSDKRHWPICFITLLFVFGLRCNLFAGGDTVEEVLATAQADGGQIRWKEPQLPVIPR